MSDILANYHTHTPRCQHAEGSEEEYIRSALKQGYQVLGFSDHTPWNYSAMSPQARHIRMDAQELEDYISTLKSLREAYAGQLRLHIGLEAEYFPEALPWLDEQCEKLGIEYLLLGCHYDSIGPESVYLGRVRNAADIRRYADLVQEGLESGRYVCLAHPDLFLNGCTVFDAQAETACRQICEAAVKTGTVLEYNLAGYLRRARWNRTLGYTTDQFWEIAAEYPVSAVLGSDAHAPEEVAGKALVRERQEYLRGLGIRVLDLLPELE
ncbi:MAG: histidinol-phosphatase [Faecalibacterium sp.]